MHNDVASIKSSGQHKEQSLVCVSHQTLSVAKWGKQRPIIAEVGSKPEQNPQMWNLKWPRGVSETHTQTQLLQLAPSGIIIKGQSRDVQGSHSCGTLQSLVYLQLQSEEGCIITSILELERRVWGPDLQKVFRNPLPLKAGGVRCLSIYEDSSHHWLAWRVYNRRENWAGLSYMLHWHWGCASLRLQCRGVWNPDGPLIVCVIISC